MRSGVGPGADLQAHGIPVVGDLPGGGGNLLNHPTVRRALHLPPASRQAATLRTWPHCVLRYSSDQAGCSRGDRLIFPANKASWHRLGMNIGAAGVCVYKPYSQGSVKLRSASPEDTPDVRFNLLSDVRDHDRLVDGLRTTLSLLSSPEMQAHVHEVFLPPGGQSKHLNQPSARHAVES